MVKVAFIKRKKLTCIAIKTNAIFAKKQLIRSDIFFAKRDQYSNLHLKRKKTNRKHTKVQIILTTANKHIYLIDILKLFYKIII